MVTRCTEWLFHVSRCPYPRMGKKEVVPDNKQGRITLDPNLLSFAEIQQDVEAVRVGQYWRLGSPKNINSQVNRFSVTDTEDTETYLLNIAIEQSAVENLKETT